MFSGWHFCFIFGRSETGYPDWNSVWFSSVSTSKCQHSTQIGHVCLLPHSFPFIVHKLSYIGSWNVWMSLWDGGAVSRLYASPTQIAKCETVCLAGLYPLRYSVLVLVHTTVPLARLQPQPSHVQQSKSTGAENHGSSSSEDDSSEEEQESVQGTDFDSLGPVRNWIVLSYILLGE